MARYTYTIFDSNPHETSGTAWPSHTSADVEAETDADACDQVANIMGNEAEGLYASDGYEPGQRLWALVWSDGTIVGEPTYTITAEDLRLT